MRWLVRVTSKSIGRPGPLALALILFAAALGPVWGSVYGITTPGAWPGGRITWFYNPAGRPATVTDAEILEAVTAAFAGWKRVCHIDATYGGITATPADPSPSGAFVVGWVPFGSSQFTATGGFRSSSAVNGYRPFTGGSIRLNTDAAAVLRIRASLDRNAFSGLMQHEVGHVLGLAHSDDPTSVMFANPYHYDTHEMELQGDDIAACADLYGGKGLISRPDRRNDVPVAMPFQIQASVQAELPTSAFPVSSLPAIDPTTGATAYFAHHWRGMALGSRVQRQWISPLGSPYATNATISETFVNGYRYATASADTLRLPLAGRWSFQVLVDQQLAASVPFEVLRPAVPPVAAFEAAVVGERDARGAINWRTVPFGSGKPVVTQLVAGGAVLPRLTTEPQAGSNRVELWLQTDRPRYKTGQTDGQPATSLDSVRRVEFATGADGSPLAAPIRVAESGTLAAYAASATVVLNQPVEQGVYVAAQLSGTLYFRTAAGWGTQAAPLVTARGPAVVALDVLRGMDVRSLPADIRLYVGYGSSLDEVVSKNQYVLVRSF